MMNDTDRRKLWKRWHKARDAELAAWKAAGYPHPGPPSRPMPSILKSLPCGAKTRAGTPCKRTDIFSSGRCKFHGGMSTGPRTAEGLERARANRHKAKGGA